MNFRKNWWKYLTILLLFYVFLGGFLVPLKPGITSVNPNRFTSGQEIGVVVECYNTDFHPGQAMPEAWLKIQNDHFLQAKKITVLKDNQLDCRFDIPLKIPVEEEIVSASLVIQSAQGEIAVLPSAVFLRQDKIRSDLNTPFMGWQSEIDLRSEPTAFKFPFRNILLETIRNTFFHTAIWFAMITLLMLSVYHSIKYLRSPNILDDLRSKSYTSVGIVFGLLGTATGSVWARYTWGAFWTGDVKLNMTAIALLIYLAYWILRASVEDPDRRARVAASYNIFAFVALIPLIFVIPRMTDSLHPGSGGNPAMGGEDLDHTLRLIFYPAIIAYILLGYWIYSLYYRVEKLIWNSLEINQNAD